MIAVVGDLMVDIFLLSELKHSEQRDGTVVRPGGSAANTAVWLAKQERDVCFAGCVGFDWMGVALRAALQAAGVRPFVRAVPGEVTGSVLVEVGAIGERTMRSSRGANTQLSSDDITRIAVEEPRFLHLTGYSLLGISGIELLQSAARLAHAVGACLTFDPSSEGVIRAVGRENLLCAIEDASVQVLIPNREEACALAGTRSTEDAITFLADYAPMVAIKVGPDGCIAIQNGKSATVSTPQMAAVDSTGAGDGFNAGLLAGLDSGLGLEESCKTGNDVAGRVLNGYGGWPELPA